MSSDNLCQIRHRYFFDVFGIQNNRELAKEIVTLLRQNGLNTKDVANAAKINLSKTRHWFHHNTGFTALDLLRLAKKYKFIKQFILSAI